MRTKMALLYPPSRQQGAALILSLVFLLILTILGVTAVSTSTLQEKMAGNMKDQNIAFQATESALRAGEAAIVTLVQAENLASGLKPVPDTTASGGIYSIGSVDTVNETWWKNSANGTPYGVATYTELKEAVVDPKYAIEFAGEGEGEKGVGALYGPTPVLTYYRVTAHGYGGTSTAQTVMQSTFKVP